MQEDRLIQVQDLCVHHDVELGFIYSLQEHGLIELTTVEEQVFVFSSQLSGLEKMIHLHHDLDVNIEGIDVIQHLLKKLEDAQDEICRLRNRLRFYGEQE